jgi:hypothetical protein
MNPNAQFDDSVRCTKSLVRLIACAVLFSVAEAGAADATGLVAEFRFDGETRNRAAPWQSLEAEAIVFTMDRFEAENRAALFPDSGFIGSSQHGYIKNRTRWSWTGWIKPANTNLDNRMLYSEDVAGNLFDIKLNRDKIVVSTFNEDVPSQWTAAIGTIPVEAGVWQHVAVTFDSPDETTGTCTIYQDGVKSFFGQLPVPKVSTNPPGSDGFAIGSNSGSWFAGQVAQRFEGGIDDVLIFSRGLTSAEIPATMDPNLRLAVFVAVEIEFFAEEGKTYQLQWSADLSTWYDHGPEIVGEDQPVAQFASTRVDQKLYWRFQEVR